MLKWANGMPQTKRLLRQVFSIEHKSLNRDVMGLRFTNPIGLAAGFDKNGTLINEFESLGFGFIEIGTVTPKGQAGNSKPRLFRLPKDQALINRMGFNNLGVEAMVQQLKSTNHQSIIIGGNIGKNKVTPNEEAISDYVLCFEALYPHVDYFAVNVSSPNTPNLRALQDKEPLQKLLSRLQEQNQKKDRPKPILLKISPDLSTSQLSDIVTIINATNLTGVITSNTTIQREDLSTNISKINKFGPGGLSGQPLINRSIELVKYFRQQLGPDKVIIGVGGIDSVHMAMKHFEAGADLIQLYSGMVYQGPSLITKINKELIVSD